MIAASDDGERARTPLVSEMGYWRLSRPATEPTPAPGCSRRSAAPVARTADDVELLRNAEGGFDIEVVDRPLRRGQRAVPRPDPRPAHRHRDRRGRAHRRRQAVRRGSPHVRPRRRPPALGVGHRGARPRARRRTPRRVSRGSTDARAVRARPRRRRRRVADCRHLGNPLGEQRALAAGRGGRAARRPRRARRRRARTGCRGSTRSRRRRSTGLAPGESTELLVLDPHGHVEHAASVVDDGETTWLIVDRGGCRGAAVVAAQDAVPPARRPARRERRVRRHRRHPRGARDRRARPRRPDVPLVWTDPWPDVAAGGHAYAHRRAAPRRRARLGRGDRHARRGGAHRGCRGRAASSSSPGSPPRTPCAIAAWRPRWATEVDDRALPHELDWLRTAVHLEKGCYRGQETVAKVHNLGHPPRRLVALQLDGSDRVLPGRTATRSSPATNAVGAVTSAALHFEEGPIALAIVRRNTAGRCRRSSCDTVGRPDRRRAGGHRPARGRSHREHPASAAARPPSGLRARSWATRRSRPRPPSRPAGAGASIRAGARRACSTPSIAILQIVVATTGAYAFAHYVLGHPAPLLAATVCVSSLGLVRDARPRRVLETVARDAGGHPRRRAAADRGRARAGGSSRWRSASRSSSRASSRRRRASRSPRPSRR